jgi:hypothetical protein
MSAAAHSFPSSFNEFYATEQRASGLWHVYGDGAPDVVLHVRIKAAPAKAPQQKAPAQEELDSAASAVAAPAASATTAVEPTVYFAVHERRLSAIGSDPLSDDTPSESKPGQTEQPAPLRVMLEARRHENNGKSNETDSDCCGECHWRGFGTRTE